MIALYITLTVSLDSWAEPMKKMDTSLFAAKIAENLYFVSPSHFSEAMIRRFATQQHPDPSNVSLKRAELPAPKGVEQSLAAEMHRRISDRDEEGTGFYAG